jgi:hypothetical protein
MGVGRLVIKNHKHIDGTCTYEVYLRFRKHERTHKFLFENLEKLGCWIIRIEGYIHDGSIKQMVVKD